METGIDFKVDAVDMGEEGVSHILTINKPHDHGYRLILSDEERARLALELVKSLPSLPRDDRNNLTLSENTLEEYVNYHTELYRYQAKSRFMHAAKAAGAKDKEEARDMANNALNRTQGDRSLLSPEEWDRACETIKEMGPQK